MRINAKSVFALLIAAITISTLGAAPASAFNSGDAVTYTQTITTPANPAANFSGSSGLDTWDVAVDDGKIYGVVHVDPKSNRLRITCNNTSDGSICANYPLTINSYAPANYYPLIYVDPTTHYLWTIAINSDQNVYSLCVDLVTQATCETTILGTTSIDSRSNVMQKIVNRKLYGFYFPSTGSLNEANVYCYDITTRSVCNSQPYRMSPDSLTDTKTGRILETGTSSKAILSYAGKLFCFDTTANAPCSGSWPVDPQWQNVTYRDSLSSAFTSAPEGRLGFSNSLPHITDSVVDGTCFTRPATGVWECLDFSGSTINAPSGLESQFAAAYNSVCVTYGVDDISRCVADTLFGGTVFGSRVYALSVSTRTVPDNATTKIDYFGHVVCFDFSTNATCAGFSRDLTGMYVPYTTYIDPANPSCMWANGDSGVAQIQNFDAYTGGACGASGSRVLMTSYIEEGSTCAPTSYGTLKIISPTDYSTAKVTLLDSNGESLGIAQQSFNGSREVDLSSLSLPTSSGSQPQMLIELKDGNGDLINSAIQASLSWDGSYDTSCLARGQQASGVGGGGGGNSGEITSADEVTVEEGELVLLQNETDITDPTWSLDGGADEDLFTITAGGKLKFKTAQPVGDYVVVIKAKHGSTEDTQTITVHVVAQLEVGSPAPATRQNASGGKTKFEWTEATNAVNYKVKLGKKVLCQSAQLTCKAKGQWLSNKKIYVYAFASNGDKKRALAVPQDADPVAGDKVKLGMVHFDLDSSFIDITAVHLLDKYVRAIKKAGYTKIFVYGHTDNQGPAPHDISLSYRRARQVWMYLDKRIDNVKFVYKGFSRHEPAKPNSTEANLAFNRRVEIWAQ